MYPLGSFPPAADGVVSHAACFTVVMKDCGVGHTPVPLRHFQVLNVHTVWQDSPALPSTHCRPP
jgi:hypothetical protein